jgi:hypothetical protein
MRFFRRPPGSVRVVFTKTNERTSARARAPFRGLYDVHAMPVRGIYDGHAMAMLYDDVHARTRLAQVQTQCPF